MRRAFLLGGAGLLVASTALAREYDREIIVDSPEELYGYLEAGELDEDTVDLLVALMERPIDLNRADSRLLYDLPAVTYKLAQDIIAYRQANGPFASVDDLMRVPGMSGPILESMAPFVTVGGPSGAARQRHGLPVQGKAKVGTITRDGLSQNPGAPTATTFAGPQAYLKAHGTGYDYFGFGLITTYRTRTQAYWDPTTQYLMSDGPQRLADLDNVFVSFGYGSFSGIAGTFDVGFGESLTFDTSTRRDPHGWYELEDITEDNEDGKLRVSNGLFGGAVSLLGYDLPTGWIDATGFFSSQLFDTHNDIWFGVEGDTNGQSCDTDADCPDGYTCRGDRLCGTSRVYDPDYPGDTERDHESVTLKDSYRETLFGGNVTFNLDEASAVGVTAYRAYTSFAVGPETSPRFASGSALPSENGPFGAVGLFGRTAVGPVMLSSEYAYTGRGGHAWFGRGIYSTDVMELTAALRHYGPWFENPHGRPQAQADEDFGLRARNEQGVSLEAVVTAVPRLRSVTVVDVYRHRYLLGFDAQGDVTAKALPVTYRIDPFDELALPERNAYLNLRSRQTLSYAVTSKENVSATFKYDDNDLAVGGRDEFMADETDSTLESQDAQALGRGSRAQLRADVSTRRVPKLTISAGVGRKWTDVPNLDQTYDRADKLRLRVTARPWEEGVIIVGGSAWLHQACPASAQAAGETCTPPDSDRDEPRYTAFLDLKQGFLDDFTVRLRYGLLNYFDERPGSYTWYQLAKVSVEGRF